MILFQAFRYNIGSTSEFFRHNLSALFACSTAQYDSRYIGHVNFRRELRFPHRMHSVSVRWGPRLILGAKIQKNSDICKFIL